MKPCPFCDEQLENESARCTHCGEYIALDAEGIENRKKMIRSERDKNISTRKIHKQMYEYYVHKVEDGLLKEISAQDIMDILNDYAKEGWRLHETSRMTREGWTDAHNEKLFLVFEREII